MKHTTTTLIILLLLSGIATAITVEQNVNFKPSDNNVTYQSRAQFNTTEITITHTNLTVDNITYSSTATNPATLNISLSSTLKRFININDTTTINIQFYNLINDTPYNDVLNFTGNVVLTTNADDYNTTIHPNQETRISDYPGTGAIHIYPQSNYTNSLWMIDFGLASAGTPDYNDSSCGLFTSGTVTTMDSSKKGSYALNYNSQKGGLGSTEARRLSISQFPGRTYADTYRVFFWINGTTTENTTTEIDLNFTAIMDRTSSSMTPDTDTYRLYRISRYGGIHNDTGTCLEQPSIIG